MHHLSPSSRKFRSRSLNRYPCAVCHGAEQAEVASSAEFCPQTAGAASSILLPCLHVAQGATGSKRQKHGKHSYLEYRHGPLLELLGQGRGIIFAKLPLKAVG